MSTTESQGCAESGKPIDLALLSMEELKDLAKRQHLTGYSGMKRPQLVALLRKSGVGTMPHFLTTSDLPGQCGLQVDDEKSAIASLATLIASLQNEVHQLREDVRALKSQPKSPEYAVTGTDAPGGAPSTSILGTSGGETAKISYSDTVRSAPVVPMNAPSATPPKFGTTWSRSVTSYYHKPRTSSDRLSAGTRVKCCAIYVGSIDRGCSSASLVKWCERKKVPVIKCSVSESQYFGLAYAHVVVPNEHRDEVLSAEFWPNNVRVREWRFRTDKISDN